MCVCVCVLCVMCVHDDPTVCMTRLLCICVCVCVVGFCPRNIPKRAQVTVNARSGIFNNIHANTFGWVVPADVVVLSVCGFERRVCVLCVTLSDVLCVSGVINVRGWDIFVWSE